MFAKINGCNLHYEVVGSGKPAIMCLHGAPGLSSGDETKGWVGPLVDDHTIVFFDHRGNGRSDDPPVETLTHTQMVDDIDGLRAHLGFEKVVIFGGSYGGFLGLEYALAYPDRLSHLILRGTGAWSGPPDEAYESAMARGVDVDPVKLKRLFDGHVTSNDDYQALFRAIYPLYSTKFDPAQLDASMAGRYWHYQTHNKVYGIERHGFDVRDRLGEITTPTLVLAGRHDWITPPRYSEEIAAGIPGAELAIYETAGHSVHTDIGGPFFERVRQFIHQGA